jgi:hypothetical protein
MESIQVWRASLGYSIHRFDEFTHGPYMLFYFVFDPLIVFNLLFFDFVLQYCIGREI